MSDRLELQLRDALAETGVIPLFPEIHSIAEDSTIIRLGYAGAEMVVLAAAIEVLAQKMSQEVALVLKDCSTGAIFSLENGVSRPVDISEVECEEHYALHSFDRTWEMSACGNAIDFKRVSENKRLSRRILNAFGFRTPKEMYLPPFSIENLLHGSIEKACDMGDLNSCKIKSFLTSLGEDRRLVLKPLHGKCGEGVRILDLEQLNEDLMGHVSPVGTLCQEKVESYPIFDGETRKDWNVRVLTTWDLAAGVPKILGIVGRIDNDGGPVNRSISADYISLEDIGQKAGWNSEQLCEAEENIKRAALGSVSALYQHGKKRMDDFFYADRSFNSQDLAGVDIILDENFEPFILEINDSNSGCLYELMKLEGIESLEPLAYAILLKARLIESLIDALNEELSNEQVVEKLTTLAEQLDKSFK